MHMLAGTARLQLVHKGDINYKYTDLANILPMGGILSIGLIAWLLDKKARLLSTFLSPWMSGTPNAEGG